MAKTHSLPVDPPQQALDWMSEYQKNALLTFIDANGATQPLHGVSFDVDDIADLIKNLNNNNHKVFLGLAKRGDGSHTIVIGATEKFQDAQGDIQSRFIHNAVSQKIYDYGEPCPKRCPKTIEPT